jgi:DNA polymerase III delta prime subunit
MNMAWTELHARILSKAFENVLGRGEAGSMAFVRCLTPDIVKALALDPVFAPSRWQVWRVADADNESARAITADHAVEMRESRGQAALLLVDTAQAGAGMDGIYSATREVDEPSLFAEALRLAAHEVTRQLSRETREYAERAVRKARGYGRRFSISVWTEFDFFIRVAADKRYPGEYLYLLGLWPIQESDGSDEANGLDVSRMFVDRLLGTTVSGLTPARRIEGLKLLNPSDQQSADLERYLRSAATKPLLLALEELADKKHLWVNALQIEGAAASIQSIELSSWRTNTGRIAKWSGLVELGDFREPPVLILRPDAEKTGDYSKLEVKWKARPENLEKAAVEYRVVLVTDMEEELASQEVSHSGKGEERCRFSNDDFSTLSEDALISARVLVSVIGNESIEPQSSEEFVICFGQPPEPGQGGVGKKVRAFSEGLMELDNRDMVSAVSSASSPLQVDSKGFVLLRTPQRGKTFRVFRPSLIEEVEKQWTEQTGAVGRWRVRVRASGTRAGAVEFVPFSRPESPVWDRASAASRRMAERFAVCGGGVGQVYDEESKVFDTVVKEYLLAWAALLEGDEPALALVNTVEVQSLSGRTIGLIVLPSHPLRVAWHVAYDNLVLHARFAQNGNPQDIRKEMAILDGALFPPFLPGVDGTTSFVFADMLGFHAVGMVCDGDKEPKAAVALLTRALGETETADTSPTVGKQSAQILGNEIIKYLECHNTSRLLHIHALRPGDGFTVARSLGHVQKRYRKDLQEEDFDEEVREDAPAFVLELYPSQEQRGVVGRFIAETREKRRSGAGTLSGDDCWMLESLSLPGGVNLPRLRWARKSEQDPQTAAHLAVAFDTFESRIVNKNKEQKIHDRPLYAFGLLSFFEREYSSNPSPLWHSFIALSGEGEKHPSDRTHTERLARLQQIIQKCVARTLGVDGELPMLKTEICPEKARNLRTLHRLCDWVITLDRNAGVEYFDSPRDNKEIYDAYVIDCVPEREDLGCLQLITSTSNLEEVRNLLDGALDQMGLSRSRRNAEFLMEHLKALSGRLAIRLTGQKAPRSELIALALCHANCRNAREDSDCWVPLKSGFIIPVDDVRDLLPPLMVPQEGMEQNKNEEKVSRPDLIHVSLEPRKGLLFRFIEVKYRRHLRAARDPEELQRIRDQVGSLRDRWDKWYSSEAVCSSFRAIRRAKLARVLHFYADKARRHNRPWDQYEMIASEIDRMVEKGGDYVFASMLTGDRGWVFCPEYAGVTPLLISPAEWDTRIFMFGPGLLPDSDFRRESILRPPGGGELVLAGPLGSQRQEGKQPDGDSGGADGEEADPGELIVGQAANLGEDTKLTTANVPSVCLGVDVFTGTEVRWPLTVKGNPHLLVAGLPGMGKTTCLLNLCSQMLSSGIRPIVFSYHQDIDAKLKDLVNSVRFIDFHGLGFNPLRVMHRESRMAYLDVAGSLRDIFVAVFPELGELQGECIRKAIKDSFIEAGWASPDAVLAELHEPEFKRFVEILRDDPKPDQRLRTLLTRLEELGDYGFFELGESRENLWESKEPIVIRIHTTQNDNLQRAFASLVFYGLYKDMFRRGIQDRITHAIIFDEAHRAAGLKLIPTMAKECRKYGISLVLASQEAKDFNISLFSAIANYLVLRLTDADAKSIVRNVARSDQERALIDRIKQMDRFRALYFCEGRVKPAYVALSS